MNPLVRLRDVLRRVARFELSKMASSRCFTMGHIITTDRRVGLYDLVVGTWLYNGVMWGASPREYAEFVRQAVSSNLATQMQEAGCGSIAN
jgi:hypothetical protein